MSASKTTSEWPRQRTSFYSRTKLIEAMRPLKLLLRIGKYRFHYTVRSRFLLSVGFIRWVISIIYHCRVNATETFDPYFMCTLTAASLYKVSIRTREPTQWVSHFRQQRQ